MPTDMRGEGIPVLDHGYVKLIAQMGSDETIIEAARMSTGKGFEGWDKDQKLLEYLYKNKHMTPFEMCELHIEVQAPIFVFREWHRHRTQSFNEMSARYVQMPNLHYVPAAERICMQGTSNKQGSGAPFPLESANIIRNELENAQQFVYDQYEQLLSDDVSKEIARINTPVSRYSRMRAKTDLRNWLGFLSLRCAPAAQWEIRKYANAVHQIIKQIFPRTAALWEEYDQHGVHLSRTEREQLLKALVDPVQLNTETINSLMHRLADGLP